MATFSLVSSSSLTGDGNIPIRKYKSTSTGLSVVLGQVEGPLVNGYLCIATESHDDDGLPHTLEHLIFLGSEEYPYKGVLDLAANRCLASGTNAWTDTDHTCYTLTTAGAQGFLNILPIYLDHVLYPTLTDSGFITEVHHINGNGEDAGVVYCEMQARENTGPELCQFALLRALFPGKCGYKSNTGGLMKNLRESTTNDKIRSYHRDYYRPENLCVIIVGEVNPDAVFEALAPVESKILNKRSQETPQPYVRPWQTPVPPFPSSVEQTVNYPSDDDNNGLVLIGWRGPKAINEYENIVALSLLMDYLNDTAISPLQHEFVECEDAYCGSVDFSIYEGYESCLVLTFESVEKEKLNLIKDKLFDLLKRIANKEEAFDMQRMFDVIHRKKMQLLSTLETSPYRTIALNVIGDFLYGNSEEDLRKRVQQIPIIETLSKKDLEFWLDLLKLYFIGDVKYVLIIGQPSKSTMIDMANQEQQRVNDQRSSIGSDGLKNKEIELENAKKNNEIEPPPQVLNSIAVPGVDNIRYHSISRVNNHSPNLNIGDFNAFTDLAQIPFRFQLDSIKTNFITVRVLLNTSQCLSYNQRLLLPLWSELILESPLIREGKLIPYEDVVKQLASDTIYNNVSIGFGGPGEYSCGTYAQAIDVMMKVEGEKYLKIINWLSLLLFATQFTTERIKVIATRMFNDITQIKRKGNKVSSALIKSLNFKPESNHWAVSMYRQFNFLNLVLKRLETSPDDVINELNQLRSLITSPNNITVHVSADVNQFEEYLLKSQRIWIEEFLPQGLKNNEGNTILNASAVIPCYQSLINENELNQLSIPRGAIAGNGSVESNFLLQAIKSIDSYTHPDLPALLVLMQYLTQLEGPMWRKIRGMGLSYHYSLSLQISEGLLYFVLYKATHLVAAYKEALNIVQRHVTGVEEWDQQLLESSRSSLIFEIIEEEKSALGVSFASMLSYYKKVDVSYNKNLINLVSKITIDDMKRVGPIYLQPLFDESKARCGICCHPDKVAETITGFNELNKKLQIINLEEENFLTSL